MSDWAAILAGGAGSRFWPLSSPSQPKQFLPLAGNRPLLVEAVERVVSIVPPERILIVTGARYQKQTAALLPAIPEVNILGEPAAASTGPALTWATAEAARRDEDAALLSLHADWYIGDRDAFARTAEAALASARRHDRLITVGIVPTRPDIGYGYIVPGPPLDNDTKEVSRFVEKPNASRAAELVAQGALWNSGLFAWTAQRFLVETASVAPEIAPHLPHLDAGRVEAFFRDVTPIAVDYSHLERSDHVAVVPGQFPWDDVGTWAALLRVRPKDEAGNVSVGTAYLRNVAGCVVWADDGAVVLDGVENLVVVRAHGVTLVTTPSRAAHLKDLVAELPEDLAAIGPPNQ
jgi:mannose-1-phosphate guanylyltransferase